jgi:hypothetical protein
MYMNLLVIAIIGGLGYLWVTRGFFSALINLVCCLAAGALAFAFWEPLALLILEKAPRTGFVSFVWQSAWALGLALPFGVSFALLRAILDKALPGNIVLEPAADYVGGGVCGAAAGVVTAGMVVMSMGMLRLGTDLLGYERLGNGTGGSLVREGKLWVPVDDLVASLYGRASTGVFSTSEALAYYYPNVADVPAMMRSTEGSGKAMNVMLPAGAQVTRRYRVGSDGATLPQLLGADAFSQTQQTVVDINGDQLPAGSTLQGFVVQFAPSAREKNGQIVIGPAQVRLLTHRLEGGEVVEAKEIFPVAAISLAAATPPRYGRWRFDAPNVFVSSVGGASESLFGFEFVVPNGFEPVGLYIKGVRYDIDVNSTQFREQGGTQFEAYPSVASRDADILQGGLVGSLLEWGEGDEQLVRYGDPNAEEVVLDNPQGVWTSNTLSNGFVIQEGTQGGLEIDDNNRIVGGTSTFTLTQLRARGLERNLRINQFVNTPTTAIVVVDVSVDSPNDLLDAKAQGEGDSSPVQLVDIHGNRYDPVGYISIEREVVEVRYSPGDPLTTLGDLPVTTNSRPPPDYKLVLVFRVSAPTQLTSFEVGRVVVQRFEEPIQVDLQPDR